jgi:hypothetical protein
MIYEFTLFADIVEKIDIFCSENILYSGTDIEDIKMTEYNEEIPDELTDKVFTMTIYNDPVVAVDGFTYERASITKWFNGSNKSPITGQVLETLKLYSNNEMRSRCIEWK